MSASPLASYPRTGARVNVSSARRGESASALYSATSSAVALSELTAPEWMLRAPAANASEAVPSARATLSPTRRAAVSRKRSEYARMEARECCRNSQDEAPTIRPMANAARTNVWASVTRRAPVTQRIATGSRGGPQVLTAMPRKNELFPDLNQLAVGHVGTGQFYDSVVSDEAA